MRASQIRLDLVLRDLIRLPGLYLLGAGMSAGHAPFGSSFMAEPALDYLRNSGGFPAERPAQNLRTRRVRAAGAQLTLSDIYPERAFLAGMMDDYPLREMLERMNDSHVYLYMAHMLTRARTRRQQSHSYELFRHFPPSLLLNYNLDGMAQKFCGARHRVFAMHGVFPDTYGSDDFERVLAGVREFGFGWGTDTNILCEPERIGDLMLGRKLVRASSRTAGIVALIGYSFGRQSDGFDDAISLTWVTHHLRGFQGPVYVFDPAPQTLRDMLADAIESDCVVGVPAYWNVFAHAAIERLVNPASSPSLAYRCEQILDRFGERCAFPLEDRT